MWLSDDLISFITDPNKAKGVFKGRQESGTPHAVFVVGYSNPDQYWILKNSFGTETGDGGYLKVGYGEAGIMEPDNIYGLNFVGELTRRFVAPAAAPPVYVCHKQRTLTKPILLGVTLQQ
jgi:C1A family cysteine protease